MLYQALSDKGFNEREVSGLAENLIDMKPELIKLLDQWLINGQEHDYEVNGMSISKLMKVYGLQYQAALLTMDWVIKEPEVALEAISKGIR